MDVDAVFQRISGILADLAGKVEALQCRVAAIENDLGVIDAGMRAALEVMENHGRVLKALTQPRPAPKRTLN